MHKSVWLGIGILGAIAIYPTGLHASPVLSEIQASGELRVGLRNDSPLFGEGEAQQGYCRDFAEALAKKLSEQFDQTITVSPTISTTPNRWQLLESGQVHMECGPNTINPEREKSGGVIFSDPFFVTATQILAPLDETTVRQGTIGLIADTTTVKDLQQWQAQPRLNDQFTSRVAGIQAALQGEISGFASDGILLVGDAFKLQIDPSRYQLLTPRHKNRPFCAPYGMLLPSGEENASWRAQVNQLIQETTPSRNEKRTLTSDLWASWFSPFLPYLQAVIDECE